jgi:hypothetical protein
MAFAHPLRSRYEQHPMRQIMKQINIILEAYGMQEFMRYYRQQVQKYSCIAEYNVPCPDARQYKEYDKNQDRVYCHHSAKLLGIINLFELNGSRLVLQTRNIIRIAAVFTCVVKFHKSPFSIYSSSIFIKRQN